jgi:hypothetical protein
LYQQDTLDNSAGKSQKKSLFCALKIDTHGALCQKSLTKRRWSVLRTPTTHARVLDLVILGVICLGYKVDDFLHLVEGKFRRVNSDACKKHCQDHRPDNSHNGLLWLSLTTLLQSSVSQILFHRHLLTSPNMGVLLQVDDS